MAKAKSFNRGLSPDLMAALQGPLAPVLRAVDEHGLDLHIRDSYINVYEGRCVLLDLEVGRAGAFRIKIHEKYRAPADLLGRFEPADWGRWAARFVEALAQLRDSARAYHKPEGGAEFAISVAHRKPPFLVLDRQMQRPGVRNSKVDLVALSFSGVGPPSVILVELKEGEEFPDAKVLIQVDRYKDYYAPEGRLLGDVAASLEVVAQQKEQLRLISGVPADLRMADLPVEMLVVYVSRGAAVPVSSDRRTAGAPVWYVGLGAGECAMPERARWEVLRGPDGLPAMR
jgi:hypothetical protein